MEIRFATRELEWLYTDAGFPAGLPSAVVTALRKRVQAIRAAPDERAFYALKSLHFEKLKGPRSHQHSMRLNQQWRLILEFEGNAPGKVVVVISIEDYH
jgi:proteic killer suppression protein